MRHTLHYTAKGIQNCLGSEVFRRNEVYKMLLPPLLLLEGQKLEDPGFGGLVEPSVGSPRWLDLPLQELPIIAANHS